MSYSKFLSQQRDSSDIRNIGNQGIHGIRDKEYVQKEFKTGKVP